MTSVPVTRATPAAPPSPPRRFAAVLRAPLRRRALAELLYVVSSVPLAAAGAFYVAVAFGVGFGLAVTFLGVPLIAAALTGARSIGSGYRRFAGKLLGIAVPPPEPLPRPAGLFHWLRTRLTDEAGWRAAGYLVLKPPTAVLILAGTGIFWGIGATMTSYPLWWWWSLPPEAERTPAHAGSAMTMGDIIFDSWPRAIAVAVAGLLLVMVAPRVTHLLVGLDRALVRMLLSRSQLSTRVRDLEESRAQAVDESVASLRKIERDLHDGTQSRLVALAMQLGMAQDELGGQDAEVALDRAKVHVDSAHQSAKDAIAELRDLVRGIHPPILDSGLPAALESLVARSGAPVRLFVDVAERPSVAVETIAYFCVAELLNNVAKHSRAKSAVVTVSERDSVLQIRVTDDGIGGAGITPSGTGLAGLTDRVRTVDGAIDIVSPPGGPTIVTIDLPARV